MDRHRRTQATVVERGARASTPPVAAPSSLPRPVALPDRKYFKIGEVSGLVGVEPHVLRYWETQFPQIRPVKARSGHRLYRRRDVETLLVVRELLHVQRYTIAGARQALRQQGTSSLLPQGAEQLSTPPIDDAEGLGDEEITELHLADPIPPADTTEVEVIGLQGSELARALGRQQAEMSAARRGADVAEVAVAPTGRRGRLRHARRILEEAAVDLERLLARF